MADRDVGSLSLAEVRTLAEELAVHQTELQLQNEQLRTVSFELETARDRFRDLFDFGPVAYLILDRDGQIVAANLKAGELFGVERGKLAGRAIHDFVATEDQDRFYLYRRGVVGKGDLGSCEVRLRSANGAALDVQIESVPDDNARDEHRRWRTAVVDISARVQAEAALLEAKRALESEVAARTAERDETRRLNEKIADAAPLLLWIVDLAARSTVYSNGSTRALLGYREIGDLAEIPVDTLIVPADLGHLKAAVAELERSNNGGIAEVTFRVRTAAGAVRSISARITVFERNAGGRIARLLGAATDVTELRKTEERMHRLAHEAAIASERERRELAALLHDSIGQLLPLANTRLAFARDSADEATRARLDEIARLIGEAHAAATSLTFRLSPPALHEIGLVAGLQALAREMHRDHDLRVVVEDDGGPLSLSEAVEFAMYRVVHELLVNVAKHSGRSEARVRAARSGSRLSIAVEDRGAGFDPKAVRSAGMGLRSARERLEYLGGRMRIHSKPGGGTRVELSAPLHVVDPDEPEPGP